MPIDGSSRPNKRSYYTHDPLPPAIYVASGKYVSNSITIYDSPIVTLLTSDDPNDHHSIMRENPVIGRKKRVSCSSLNDRIKLYKKQGYIGPCVLLSRGFIIVMKFPEGFKS